MLESVPVPFQAILYPLAGAVIIAALGHLLPGWLRRLVATAAATASMAALWSLRNGGLGRVELFWEPLNFFRMSPTLSPDSLSLLAGLTVAGVSAAMALGIQSTPSQRANWHAILLIALAGCQVTMMAINLPTMALGSAAVDLALIALVLLSPESAEPSGQMPLAAAIPGIASTLLLFFSALHMDVLAGHTSLLAQNIPEEIFPLVAVAGVLRLLVFPLHPRGWEPVQRVALLLLPVGVGIYLLARVQTLAPAPTVPPWMLTVGGVALLAGALLAWSGSNSTGLSRFWSGMLVYQTGCALAFLILVGRVSPWPLLALTLPLASLAIWWDGGLERETEAATRPKWSVWLGQRVHLWQVRAGRSVAARFPVVERWGSLWWIRHGAVLLAIPALASLAGAPLTVGARARWPFHATLLREGHSLLLLVLVADTLVAAALWTRFVRILKETEGQRLKTAAVLAVLALLGPIVVLGIAPGSLGDGVGLAPVATPDVSVWGLGLVYVLPWLLGAWLARMRTHLMRYLDLIWRIVNLDWFYRAVGWIGRRLAAGIHWLGRVGEGEGWWGWALVILVLGIVFMASQ